MLKLSHSGQHASHAPSDVLAMATFIVILLAVALLIGASLSTMKISTGTSPVPMQGMAIAAGATMV